MAERQYFVEGIQFTDTGEEEYFIEGVQVNENQPTVIAGTLPPLLEGSMLTGGLQTMSGAL